MYRLRCGTIKLPRIYVAENSIDAKICVDNGIPFIRKTKGMTDRDIIAYTLLPTLKKMFPDIRWLEVLGIRKYRNLYVKTPPDENLSTGKSGDAGEGNEVVDFSPNGDREFTGGIEDDWGERPLEKYIGDISSEVHIEQLQDLNLLPAFLDDIATNVSKNIYGQKVWSEGYTKKLGAVLGNFDQAYEKGNLIILDVSGSIPRGVSSTMLTLLPTLRECCNADCIVTGSKSVWIGCGEEMPEPQWIRNYIGYGNETTDFFKILNEHVFGHNWGNVIVFGDNDRPARLNDLVDKYGNEYIDNPKWARKYIKKMDWSDTSVEHLWSYHTWSNRIPGYGRWVQELFDNKVPNTFNTSWCEFMEP